MKKTLMISCFDWYKVRLEPIREMLIECGYDVTVLIADFDHIKKMQIAGKYDECTYIYVPPYKNNLSIQRIHSHFFFGKSVNEWLNDVKPELIYCQVPPNNVAKYCTRYRRENPHTKLILDIIDLWPESIPLGKIKKTLPVKIWKGWRDDAVDIADHIFLECELYQKKLGLGLDKSSILYIFKEQTEEEQILIKKIIREKRDEEKIRFAYLGSMNHIIDIDGIISVVKKIKNHGYECEFHAVGDGESRERFKAAVESTGCKAYFYGSIFDELEKIKILAPCNYAFNMMKGDISVGLTIKSIDYLSYGLPLINNIKGDTWKLVEDEGIGVNVEAKNIPNIVRIESKGVIDIYQKKFTRRTVTQSVEKIIRGL